MFGDKGARQICGNGEFFCCSAGILPAKLADLTSLADWKSALDFLRSCAK